MKDKVTLFKRIILLSLLSSVVLLVTACVSDKYWHIGFQIKGERDVKPAKEVKIAVLDSGIETNGTNTIAAAYNTFTNTDTTNDAFNHGTVIANIIIDSEVGLNPHAILYDIQVLNEKGQGGWQQICAGIDKAIDFDVDIISMSLGFNYNPPKLKPCIEKAIKEQIILVASAGDSVSDVSNFPANYKEVMAVAAIDKDGKPYKFASKGKIDFVAPGVDISVRDRDGKIITQSGSSIATANFTAILAKFLVQGMTKEEILQSKHYHNFETEGRTFKMLHFTASKAE
jgi:minor extracellular protease Epr